MHGVPPRDPGRVIDWGKTSADYARHRPTYPPSFFDRLEALGIGLPGQRVLDLGTGVGFLALRFACAGARVTGLDVASGQIDVARRDAAAQGLDVSLLVTAAEDAEFPPGSFDVITASQCWLYFDPVRMIPLVTHWLDAGGRLVTCHFSWLPRESEIARRSEALVLEHNPQWTAADWSGEISEVPEWSRGSFRVASFFWYDEEIPFTRESWRGRIRACRGVAAALSPEDVLRFDEEHERMLAERFPEEFTIPHRIDAHVLEPA